MEIFIVGLAVVALMVYASTKIKKSAAAAYQPETVETAEFRLYKPEGFIYPLNDDSGFAFVANSKEWGKNEASKFRQAKAVVRVIQNSDFKIVCENAKKSSGKVKSKQFVKSAPVGQKIFLLEGETTEADVKIITFWEIIESRKKIYELKIAVLETYAEDFAERINAMTASFNVK